MTLEQLLTEKSRKRRYKKIIQKCKNLNPDERYQSVRQMRQAFSRAGQAVPGIFAVVFLLVVITCLGGAYALLEGRRAENGEEGVGLVVLSAPGNPHWKGETGIPVWDNVLESGNGDEVQFHLKVYRRDTENPPEPDDTDWYFEQLVRIGGSFRNTDVVDFNAIRNWEGNGFYYFKVSAAGDGVQYADSPYAVSDAFEYTGESAPFLPAPTGLEWRLSERNNSRSYCATWSNLEDYADEDVFDVTFYDEAGNYVMNNTWTMSQIKRNGYGGILIPTEFLKRSRAAHIALPCRYILRGPTSIVQALCRIPCRKNITVPGFTMGRGNEADSLVRENIFVHCQ